jgi:murein L,D-transpeptidase YafK
MKLLAVALLVLLLPGLMQASEFPVADRVVIEKGARKLHLIQQGKAFRTYKIALGIRPVGDKKRNSDYFLSIRISYPDPKDRREAGEMGVDPGGAIMIHGQPNDPTRSETYYRTQDWTNGCIAVSNSDMIDIWLMTGENTPIEIRP